ncbi:uncharacterized protein LOC122650888 [Telopea speciosissima]|uniref:uncharacterized protein LOC122650888 n=1 Tax=Telopea speciosissima TaxID=54955 RepID=UPI001CC4F175|nr:uncharacterized protein LOC122650888 [Telopea speciosissima]
MAAPQSYAKAVGGHVWPDIDALPDPIHAGNITRIRIPQKDYEENRNRFRFALIGRVNFRLASLDALRKEAKVKWNLKQGVIMHPLGKGFVIFQFSFEGDMAEVWRRSPVRFNDQAIRFQRWKPDFNTHEQQVLTKLVWVRFPDLSLEYWHENVLLSMAKAVGKHVALDRRTRQGLLGHFARVLVEIDAGDSSTRVEEVQVERFEPGSTKEFCFTQKVIYEDGLQRCGYCRRLGHQSSLCRQKRMDELHQQEKDREASILGAIYVGEDGVNLVNSKSNSMGGSARKSLSQGKNSFSPNSKAPAGHEGIVVSNLVAAIQGREIMV